ncbi:amino acid adenylation domain-containing protein, partial [Xanthomonas arboricola]|nr:amino acid adenylation domain-containing protein [Xanthomonas arboricola]
MALTAGWAALLSRLGGQEEVVIGTPVANRPRAELEGLAGFFVNTLALRVPVDGMADAATLLMQVKAQALDAFAHQQLPFDQVVEHVRPERSLGHSPVFQTMLALNNTPGARELSLPGVRLQPQPQPRTTTQFDLSLALNEHAGALTGELEYATDLFDAATIQRWAGYLQRLLQALATTEDCAVAQLPWLPEQELAQLQAWSLPDAAWSWPALTLPALFEAQVRRTPQAEALRFEGRSLSYAGLNRAANRVAHRLLALGVKPDDRVAIRAERGLELLIGLLGILKSGAGYVPIDPAYPQARQDYMLTDSAPAALLVDAIGVAGTAACPQLAIASDEPASEDNPQVPGLRPQHLAYVIYTSGSTGQPKGVMVEHASVAAFVRTHATSCRLQPGDRVLHFASCSFDTSIEEIFPALVSGATVVVRPSWMVSPDTHFVELLAVERIAILDLPTAFFHVWAQQAPQRRPALPEQVRLVVVGGEKLERGALAGWFAHPSARYATVLNTYGPTEATVYATSIALESVPQCESQVPIGRPLRGLKISILDSCGAPVPQGVIGEIHIGGVQVARGYLGQPTLTAERFVHDQDAAGDARLYRTGDLGCWLGDGNIAYAGRRDAQIKLRGFRIEPGEIEYALRRCDGVADALVLLHDDASGASRLVAYVVAAEANAPSEQMLHSALSEKLAAYMLPSCYVLLENFPLTRSGKIDRAALPVPNASARTNSEHELPVGAVESAIARVWAGLFGLEQVGRRDNFFELGGHSLLAIAMIERLAGEGIELPVRDLFLSPVLADLAAQVSRGTTQPVPPNLIEPGRTAITPDLLPLVALSQASIDRIIDTVPGGAANVQDIYPLAPLQDGILFHHLLHAEDAADPYVLRVSLEFDGIVRMERFIDALKTVVARHDVLRTALFWQALERPVQVVLREVSLPVFDGVPGAVRMNLSAAPLLQLWRHADTGDDGLILTVLWHHIVSDAVAMGVILDEVRNLLLTDASALPPPAPYRDFIARTGAFHDSVHEAYFRERLGSVDETTAIGGIVDVRHDGAAIRQSVLRLEDDVVALIRRAATAGGTAPSVLFHAAWARVLSEHASRSDVVFGTVLTGRLQGMAQAGRTVGMFINTLPLRLDLAGRGVAEALDETRLRLAELLAHEHASLALAQRCSAVAAGIPLFTVLLNYRQHSSQTDADAVSSLGEGIRVGGAQARNNYPLTMSVDDDGTGFGLTSLSIGDIDGPALAGHLVRVVEALAAALLSDPQQRIDSLALIDAQEREQLLALGRGRSQARTRAHGLIDAFQAQAARSPQAIALRATESGESTDYATLAAHANRLAHALREQGLGPGDRIGICMERGLALPVALLAVLSSGAAYVPLDLRQGSERLARIIADANISVVLVESSSAPASLGGVDMLYLDGAGTDPDWLGEYPAQPLETRLA